MEATLLMETMETVAGPAAADLARAHGKDGAPRADASPVRGA